jgi:sugar phosphate isomerase/epimerase
MNRREMLGLLGNALAVRLLARWRAEARAPLRPLDVIGLQLYTVRRALQADFEGTIAKVAGIGYDEVEFAGYFDRPPREIRRILDEHGLRAPAAHVSRSALVERMDETLEAARAIGHRYLIISWIDEAERSTLDDWKRLAQDFNRIGERCRAAGFQFAFHNHDFEFVPIRGRVPYDLLLAETDPALVQLEIDLYWMTRGGRDPLDYFARYPGRTPLVHVKDSAGPPLHRMVDVGRGVIDFARIFARSRQAGTRHYFVEHDQPADAFASIRASYRYLRNLELQSQR